VNVTILPVGVLPAGVAKSAATVAPEEVTVYGMLAVASEAALEPVVLVCTVTVYVPAARPVVSQTQEGEGLYGRIRARPDTGGASRNWYSNEPLGPAAAAVNATKVPLGRGLAGDGVSVTPVAGGTPRTKAIS